MKKMILFVVMLVVLGGAAFAQSYDIKNKTPAVTSALDARKARFAELKALKAQGLVGENNQGYVQALGGADAGAIVSAENQDRRLIYKAIVEQNGLADSALSTVEGVFAGVQRNKASSGEKVQDESGAWITK
ncbi:MAG: DUF1318 domain-containing protein [Candidatus Omnitrophica bacterium]|nr:DUF1318 domain-containing protein [Candidatus Omnitrophota bacterium]